MDSATTDIYLQKLEEFVHDEDKIVTFKWLSTNLGISSTDSKCLLQQYVTDNRSLKPDSLALTYSLSGILDDNTLCITVVKEDELVDRKGSFVTVLNQEIYSIQKSKDVDLNTVSLVDYFDLHNPRESPVIGSIVSKTSVKRVFKAKKALPPPREPTIKGKASFFTKVQPKSSEKVDITSPKQGIPKETVPVKPKQNGSGIASFFNKSGNNKTDTKPKLQEKLHEKSIKSEEKQVVEEKVKVTKAPIDRFKNLVDSDSEIEELSSQSQSLKSKENQKPKRSTKRPRKDNKKSAPSPKRRKRIVEQEESDDDIFGNDDESIREDVIEDSEEDSEPVLKPAAPLAPKNKKRKLVDRTFTDEDGYIITRKEWVEESPSEDETEQSKSEASSKMEVEQIKSEQVKSEPKRKEIDAETKVANENKKSKKSANDTSSDKMSNGKVKGGKGKKAVATNQPTLMNFFKRN